MTAAIHHDHWTDTDPFWMKSRSATIAARTAGPIRRNGPKSVNRVASRAVASPCSSPSWNQMVWAGSGTSPAAMAAAAALRGKLTDVRTLGEGD